MRLVKDDDTVKVTAKPFDDLLDPARLAAPLLRTQRRIGREQDAFRQLDGRALTVARQGCHQQSFLPQSRPVALSILKQAVRYRNPERTAAAF